MKKLIHHEDKKKPGITAQLYMKIPFSISSNELESTDFEKACKNDYANKSQAFKRIIYKMMDVKNDNEFQKKMKDPVKKARDEIYKITKAKEGEFSKMILLEINAYIKKHKGRE